MLQLVRLACEHGLLSTPAEWFNDDDNLRFSMKAIFDVRRIALAVSKPRTDEQIPTWYSLDALDTEEADRERRAVAERKREREDADPCSVTGIMAASEQRPEDPVLQVTAAELYRLRRMKKDPFDDLMAEVPTWLGQSTLMRAMQKVSLVHSLPLGQANLQSHQVQEQEYRVDLKPLESLHGLAGCSSVQTLHLECPGRREIEYAEALRQLADPRTSKKIRHGLIFEYAEEFETIGDVQAENVDGKVALPGKLNLEGLAGCASLTTLTLTGLRNAQSLHPLSRCASLTNLTLERSFERDAGGSLEGLSGSLQLTNLMLTDYKLSSLAGLSDCPRLSTLRVESPDCGDSGIQSLAELAGCPRLHTLELDNFDGPTLKSVEGLAGCASLTYLDLSRLNALESVDLAGCAKLTILVLSRLGALKSVAGLAGCASLTNLFLETLGALTSLEGLSGCTSLTLLSLSGDVNRIVSSRDARLSGEVKAQPEDWSWFSFEGLAGCCPLLRSLSIRGFAMISSLEGLSSFTSLQTIMLAHLANLKTLDGLSGCNSLQELHLCDLAYDLESLEDIAGCSCSSLQVLDLRLFTGSLPSDRRVVSDSGRGTRRYELPYLVMPDVSSFTSLEVRGIEECSRLLPLPWYEGGLKRWDERDPDTAERDSKELIEACSNGDVGRVRSLLDSVKQHRLSTALIEICQYDSRVHPSPDGHEECMRVLLNARADVNSGWVLPNGFRVDALTNGRTALMAACEADHPGLVGILLSHGADIDLHTSERQTALYFARQRRHPACVRALLDRTLNGRPKGPKSANAGLRCEALGDFEAEMDQELSFVMGEHLTVLVSGVQFASVAPGWMWCRNDSGAAGLVPETYFHLFEDDFVRTRDSNPRPLLSLPASLALPLQDQGHAFESLSSQRSDEEVGAATAARIMQSDAANVEIDTEASLQEFELYQTVKAHRDDLPLTNAAFNKDGNRFVTGSYDRTAKVFDSVTGEELLELKGHENVVYSVAFDKAGKQIATGSFDTTAKVWDAETGELLATLGGHSSELVCIRFDLAGTTLGTGGMDSTARLWDVSGKTDNAELHVLAG